MPYAELGEVRLEYERLGDPADPTILAIMGLGAQRIVWPPELLGALAEEGFQVVSFDNRDVGLSSKMEQRPGSVADILRRYAGEDTAVPYTLGDMAKDAVELLDLLGVDRAHVMGASMGAMIAQHLAFSHPERVRTLVSIMSTTGAPDVGQATPAAQEVLLAPAPRSREAYLRQRVEAARVIGSREHVDEERIRRAAEAAYDRAYYPYGVVRQLLAILADGDRTERLGAIEAPTLVIHGAQDALIDVSGGEATAAAIPGARLLVLDEMGHDLPLPLLPQLVAAVTAHVRGR